MSSPVRKRIRASAFFLLFFVLLGAIVAADTAPARAREPWGHLHDEPFGPIAIAASDFAFHESDSNGASGAATRWRRPFWSGGALGYPRGRPRDALESMSETPREQATRLLAGLNAGESQVAEELFALVYEDLRAVAAAYLRRERQGHTLQPTALVHEAWFRLVGKEDGKEWDSKRHFYAVAARAMRRILVDHARRRNAAKRGGGRRGLPLDRLPELPEERDAWMEALDDALEDLATFDERQAQVVELRFFGGLTIEETAVTLGVSHATVERDWKVARAWLQRELRKHGPES